MRFRESPEVKESAASFSTRRSRLPKVARPKLLVTLPKLASLTGLVALVFGFGFLGGFLGSKVENSSPGIATTTAARQQYISNESELIADIANDVGQSVVSINTTSQVSTPDFFGFNRTQNQEAAGTGFIISKDGIIVTNRHVVPAGTTSVSVTLADGTTYENVQIIGRTSGSSPLDVAFVKIGALKGKSLKTAIIGDSSKVRVGDKVVAIGNALGQFQNTVTSGIISGFGRDVTAGDESGSQAENLVDLFQTDTAINEGNSGGPLVNINGEVIGINTAIAGGAQNIGFAIPINDIKGLISSVLTGGQLQQPFLGVRYVSLTNDLADQFNLKITRGAYITGGSGEPAVVPDSPAEKAGLKEGDVIAKVNSISIDDKTSLTAALSKFKVGDEVTLTVIREGKTISIEAILANAPSS